MASGRTATLESLVKDAFSNASFIDRLLVAHAIESSPKFITSKDFRDRQSLHARTDLKLGSPWRLRDFEDDRLLEKSFTDC